MIDVVVFTKPGCAPCSAVKNKLRQAEIPFAEIDVTEHPEAVDALLESGFNSVPVITAAVAFPGGDENALESIINLARS